MVIYESQIKTIDTARQLNELITEVGQENIDFINMGYWAIYGVSQSLEPTDSLVWENSTPKFINPVIATFNGIKIYSDNCEGRTSVGIYLKEGVEFHGKGSREEQA